MLFFLVFVHESRLSNYHIFTHDKIVKMADFGFLPGGSYSIRYTSQNCSQFIIFLLSSEYSSFIRSSYLSHIRVCNKSYPEVPYKVYYLDQNKSDTIESTVNTSTVLVPFVANCAGKQLFITVQYKNPDNFLDSRDTWLPFIYLSLSMIYPFISVMWIINSFLYPQFHVRLHTALALSAAFKALSLYYFAKVWYSKALLDKCAFTLQFVNELIFTGAHSLLFAVNALAVGGWGTYRDKMPADQVLNTTLITIWFFIVISICHCANYAFFLVPLYAMAVFVACIYAQMIYSDILSAIRLIPFFSRSNQNPMMPMKLELVIKFGGFVTVWMVVFVFFLIYFLVVDVRHSFENTVYEIFILFVYIIDIYIFFFKKEYEPIVATSDDAEGKLEPSKQELVLLKEPADEWFSLLDTHKFSNV